MASTTHRMPARSLDWYKLYFITRAITNVLIEWLNEGAKEPLLSTRNQSVQS